MVVLSEMQEPAPQDFGDSMTGTRRPSYKLYEDGQAPECLGQTGSAGDRVKSPPTLSRAVSDQSGELERVYALRGSGKKIS